MLRVAQAFEKTLAVAQIEKKTRFFAYAILQSKKIVFEQPN